MHFCVWDTAFYISIDLVLLSFILLCISVTLSIICCLSIGEELWLKDLYVLIFFNWSWNILKHLFFSFIICSRYFLSASYWIQVNHIECRRWTIERKQRTGSNLGNSLILIHMINFSFSLLNIFILFVAFMLYSTPPNNWGLWSMRSQIE